VRAPHAVYPSPPTPLPQGGAGLGEVVHPRIRAHGLGDFGQVLVVSEVDDLTDASHVGEQAGSSGSLRFT